MKIKKGVSIKQIKPEIIIGLMVAETICAKHGVELVVTSGSEGKHGKGSLHFCGFAVDIRTRNLKDEVQFTQDLRNALNNEFDIVLEGNHVHMEYQPKH